MLPSSPRITKFHLAPLTDALVACIAKKFNSVRTGSRFCRSSRRARNIVHWIKAKWPLPGTHLEIRNDEKTTKHGPNSWPTDCLEFCRIELVSICTCSDHFFETVVIPDIGRIGAIGMLCLAETQRPEHQLQQVVAAAQPILLILSSDMCNLASPIFKDTKSLAVVDTVSEYEGRLYWESKTLFEIVRSKTHVHWMFNKFHKVAIATFIENWLKGELTGCLGELCYISHKEEVKIEDMEELLNNPDLMRRIYRRYPNGFVVVREGHHNMDICCDGHEIRFTIF